MLFDLDKHFTFYASYHNESRNQWIHMFCVWPIFFTSLVMLAYIPNLFELNVPDNIPFNDLFIGNWSLIVAAAYIIFYMGASIRFGLPASLIVILCYFGANHYYLYGETECHVDPFYTSLAVHVFCWAAQFFGHFVFEGRKPALIDNLFQSIFASPLFVVMEWLFLFGIGTSYRDRIQKSVDKSIEQWKKEGSKKKN